MADAANISVAVSKAEALRVWMLSDSWGNDWLTLRDIVRLGPSRLRESPEARKAVEMLVEHRWLIPLAWGTVIGSKARREAWRICK